jgi:hypothetical protein
MTVKPSAAADAISAVIRVLSAADQRPATLAALRDAQDGSSLG